MLVIILQCFPARRLGSGSLILFDHEAVACHLGAMSYLTPAWGGYEGIHDFWAWPVYSDSSKKISQSLSARHMHGLKRCFGGDEIMSQAQISCRSWPVCHFFSSWFTLVLNYISCAKAEIRSEYFKGCGSTPQTLAKSFRHIDEILVSIPSARTRGAL